MVPLFLTRVVSDALVSATLCIILYDARSFARSLKLIKTLIVYAMNRFLLTTLVAIFQTVVLIIEPESIWAMIIELITAQFYVNSFFAVLNSRSHLRDMATQESIHFTSLHWPTSISRGSQVSDSNPIEPGHAEQAKYSTSGSDVDIVTMVVHP
ncbi:hypothetical protein BDN71DRAFT_1511449 [Pleurotus eryngii]|uniref:DUF6534 domain-containing protein n=1 Tax=Pleurotus eryngii TaxID=5323 RepID=A0A9P5ZL37_PLEER|nr:hypothetical protein BDN71DRAFT_1511449 [Pleurotus eryngii]